MAASNIGDCPAGREVLRQSEYRVPRMDCPSEERLIRLALEDLPGIVSLACDFSARSLTVIHHSDEDDLTTRLASLGLGAHLVRSTMADAKIIADQPRALRTGDAREAGVLRLLLLINALMFLLELFTGWLAQSTGLIADSLDMFADAGVYGMALYAVGRAGHVKMRAARLAGGLQLVLGLACLAEVLHHLWQGSEPRSILMLAVGGLALVANVACLLLLTRHQGGGIHMQASRIFTATDVLANLGVLVAGGLVAWSGSALPDLFIGALISLVVLHGAWRILRLRQ